MPKRRKNPGYRFYALYDKVYRAGRAGVRLRAAARPIRVRRVWTAKRFEDIEAYGVERGLGNWRTDSGRRRIEPQAVRRVYDPEAERQARPLGIPTIRDRVVKMAAMLVLEPIFEADLPPEQHAYRPERSALRCGASSARDLLNTGHTQVVDADLSGYFDSIPHAELHEIGGTPGSRSAHAASDQDVARGTGRGDRRAGADTANDPRTRTANGVFRKARRSHRCCRICTCGGSCWGGSGWGSSERLDARIVSYADDSGDLLSRQRRRGAGGDAADDARG